MVKYRINAFLEVKLEDEKTNIYVKDELFMQCKYVLLNVNTKKIENFDEIDSIDKAAEVLDEVSELLGDNRAKIPSKTIFWAHCSNLQAWYESDYNTSLIHSNLAFPLLRKLTIAGDKLAARVFKEEVAKRFESNNIQVKQFLIYNRYLDFLNNEELDFIFYYSENNLITWIVSQFKKLMKFPLVNYTPIKNLIDMMVFIDLNYNQKFVFNTCTKLINNKNILFARLLILHLNYKEFIDYKIPYGKFSTYFEELLNYIYKLYPEINKFLSIIDSGFIGGSFSLEDRRSYGCVSYL